MAITDELREWWVCKFPIMDKELHEDFTAITKRIDAEHERAMAAAALIAGAPMTDEHMAEHGWVRLPKDANGEPIHVGDTVEWLDEPHHPITVVGVGKNTLFYIDDDANAQWTMAITKRHHAKTVEDVLRDMLDAWGELPSNATNEAIIAEYATKLRLAESEES